MPVVTTRAPKLGTLDLDIMRVVWAADTETPLTIREIHRALTARYADRPYGYAAIETAVFRLADSDRGMLLELERPVKGYGVAPVFMAAVDCATFQARAAQSAGRAPAATPAEPVSIYHRQATMR